MIEVVGVEAWDIESKVEEEAAEEITFLESRRKNPVVGSSNLTSKPQQPGKFFPPPPEKQNAFLCQNAYDKGSYLITVVGKGDRHCTLSRELPTDNVLIFHYFQNSFRFWSFYFIFLTGDKIWAQSFITCLMPSKK